FDQLETVAVMLAFASPVQQLLFACRRGDEDSARSVLRANPGIVQTMTPADHRAVTDAAWNRDAAAVTLMLEIGLDPRTPGHDSGPRHHCAAWQGSPEPVMALLRHPDARHLVAIRDARYGATPLGWCCHGSRFGDTRRDFPEVARLLLQAGARPGAD